MKDLQCWLMTSFIAIMMIKMVWEYIQGLKVPTNEEVRDITRIDGRINALESRQNQIEITISNKVDKAVWLERISREEAFSKQHHSEMTAIKKELKEIRSELGRLIKV